MELPGLPSLDTGVMWVDFHVEIASEATEFGRKGDSPLRKEVV